MIEAAKDQQCREQRLLVITAQTQQDGCVEQPDTSRRVAGEAEQRGGDEHRHQPRDLDAEFGGNEDVHRQRRHGEIEQSDHDLQQHG
ncbi:MAG: hypothetical protein E6699_38715, partial [Bradyrhizobium sp.]|uniref:hypothetical protein n=1 Tax=Bradyrhizobium sp. TaxID=376 RepID=UPI0028FE7FEF